MKKKAWTGRFSKATDTSVEDFTSSIDFDKRLYKYDIEGSIAHAKMLAKCGIISSADADAITKALSTIKSDIENGIFEFKKECEDIHMNIEKRLIEMIGSPGGRLHTARSRNDQVALDIRMFMREEVSIIIGHLKKLRTTLFNIADDHIDIVMPGYTHLQKAQPVLFSHHILAYYEMFKRDEERFRDALKRIDVMPLGSGALAGTNFPIDRDFVAALLSFKKITPNSIDAVSDRDFLIEVAGAASIVMMHLSRLSEELIIWSSAEYKFIDIDDAFCTGSSIMPQKKNPDICELTRGKTGRVYGGLIALLTIMKSLPLAYNRDMQEDKEQIFDIIDTVKGCLSLTEGLLKKITINKDNLNKAVRKDYMTATDIADYLVRKGIPFRDAHEITGKIVSYAIARGKELDDISIGEFKDASSMIEDDIYKYIDVKRSVDNKNVYGGTSTLQVKKRIKEIRNELNVEN